MKISSAKFVRPLIPETDNEYMDEFPHIAVIGRSNVGKSSLINSITEQKDLARTSSRPGHTQQINLFLINKAVFLADLPGYGYANHNKEKRLSLENLIFWYLGQKEYPLKKIILIVDANVGATPLDLDMNDFLSKFDYPVIVIANKFDKIKKNKQAQALQNLKIQFPNQKIIPHSSISKEGKAEIIQEIIK